jgi:hypothetical protein
VHTECSNEDVVSSDNKLYIEYLDTIDNDSNSDNNNNIITYRKICVKDNNWYIYK